ncbi:MAG TPA: hypothetical protein PKM25_09430, partial [Candidatus Ozemobacteraceae bacterium]|nr:hypothetical protein [Candidatus Ozemobacteraceae bacterium]
SSLWTTAIIGLSVGAGYTNIGVVATILVLFVLVGLDIFEKTYLRGSATRTVYIKGNDRPRFVEEIKSLLSQFNISIKSVNFSKDVQNNEIEIESITKVLYDQDLDGIIGAVSRVEGIVTFKIN